MVLIVDLWRPELKSGEIAMLEGLQRYASLHAPDLSAYWSGNAKAKATVRAQYS